MTPNAKLKNIVADGSTWENLWTSYSPGMGSHAGHVGADASPYISSEIKDARAMAAAASSQRDRERNDRKRGRGETPKGQGKSHKGDGQGKGQGKKPKQRGGKWKRGF